MDPKTSHGGDLIQPAQASFNPDSGYLFVELDLETFELARGGVWFEGRLFEAKDELHITILSREAAEAVRQLLEDEPEQEDQFRRLIEESNWEFRKLERLYHVQEDQQVETIIQMVEMPGLVDFFKQVKELVGKDLELPPTHVTLYMRGTDKGIGLPTQAEFERLVQNQVHTSELEGEGEA
jgi:hypothetical protein